MDRQAHTGDAVLVKSREMIGRAKTLPRWLGGRRGKDDIKQNTLTPLGSYISLSLPGGGGGGERSNSSGVGR
jgi:hypothetical protein